MGLHGTRGVFDTWMYTDTHRHTDTHTHTYTDTQTHRHTHTHTHTRIDTQLTGLCYILAGRDLTTARWQ